MEELSKKLPREVRKYPNATLPGVVWDDGVPNRETAIMFYENIQASLNRLGIHLADKNIKVLEIGSGNTIFLDYMRKQGVNATGVDVRPRGSKQSPQVIARVEQLPFIDKSFDVVLSLGTVFDNFQYEQDQDSMMKEITRVLKNSGVYYGSGVVKKNRSNQVSGLNFLPNESDVFKSLYKKS